LAEQRLKIEKGLARAAGTEEQKAEGHRLFHAWREDCIGDWLGEVL
jgi:hypothetical protein